MTAKRSEKVTFAGAQGQSLAARLDLPAGEPRAFALFAHCFTCSKDIFAAARIAAALSERGIAVLRFDFTGLGSSEGEFANTNFTSNLEDLIAAATYLQDHHQAPKLLIGHSLGGAAVLAAASRVPEAVAVATIGAPADPAHVAENFTTAIAEIEKTGEAEVSLGGRPIRIKKQFLDDISAHNMDEAIGTLRKALLIFHGPRDKTVGIENAGAIFQAAKHPKSFVSLDDADHLLSRRADAIYVADVISAWAARYLASTEEAEQREPALTAKPGTIVVAETGEGKFAQAISIGGRHDLRADEPVTYGGTDTGGSPYDLLLASLGACTSMTLRMYAERKRLPLERVSVTLSHDKIHAEDCGNCETETGKIDRIQRRIDITGALTPDQRARLMQIADMCPVHRTLHSEVLVETRVSD